MAVSAVSGGSSIPARLQRPHPTRATQSVSNNLPGGRAIGIAAGAPGPSAFGSASTYAIAGNATIGTGTPPSSQSRSAVQQVTNLQSYLLGLQPGAISSSTRGATTADGTANAASAMAASRYAAVSVGASSSGSLSAMC